MDIALQVAGSGFRVLLPGVCIVLLFMLLPMDESHSLVFGRRI